VQISKLVLVKGQYIVLLHLNTHSTPPSVESRHVQLIDTKFTISGQFLWYISGIVSRRMWKSGRVWSRCTFWG